MSLVIVALLVFLFFQSLKNPTWGLISIFGVLILEQRIADYLDSSALLIQAFGALSMFSLAIHTIMDKKHKGIDIGLIQLLIILFIIWIIIASPDTAFGDGERNWVFTYTQLLALTVVAGNSIKNISDLRKLMLWFALFNAFDILLFLLLEYGSGNYSYGGNEEARFYIIAILFVYFLFKNPSKHESVTLRIILPVLFILLFFGLIVSESRTIYLVALLMFGYILVKDYGINLSGVLIFAIPLGIALYLVPADNLNYIKSTITGEAFKGTHGAGELNSLQDNIRLLIWKAGFDMIGDRGMLTGVGIGNFSKILPQYFAFNMNLGAHNAYLNVLFETGIVGLTLFMSIVLKTFNNYKRLIINSKLPNFIWYLSFIVIMIGALTKHDHHSKLFFLFIGVSTCINHIIQKEVKKKQPSNLKLNRLKYHA